MRSRALWVGWVFAMVAGTGCSCGKDPAKAPGACQSDADCPSGAACIEAVCQTLLPNDRCYADADCQDARFGCDTSAGTCVRIPQACLSDADCSEGQLCSLATQRCTPAECGEGETRDCGESDLGACRPGNPLLRARGVGALPGAIGPAGESCDGLDNDCDGEADENVTIYTEDGSGQSLEPVLRPVDVILVVNDPSMTDEIVSVEANINGSFAAIMEESGLDYRVILLSKHGSASNNQSICIRPPLGGNTSCSQSCPANGSRFFHYSTEIGSHDSLSRILETFAAPDACGKAPGGWSQWLRPGAARIFVEITDDGPVGDDPDAEDRMTADAFEAGLWALNPPAFGIPASRDYVFHSIVGLAESVPVLAPWLPADPLVYRRCTGAGGEVRQNGLEYQKLSQRSSGLRYPICQYQSFDAVFEEVARGIVERTQRSCSLAVSSVPLDSGMDQTALNLVGSNGSGRIPLVHVADAASCSGNSFFTESTAFKLCPEACTLWRDDPGAQLEVRFTCEGRIR